MFCRNVSVRRKKKSGSVPVYLNVYDLTPMNVYGYWLGIGIYHSGLEVHGVEYGYGAHEHSSSGIFEVEPKQCPGFTFRKSILVGETEMRAKEVRTFMEKLSEEYQGNKYHLITRNCNHFCNHVCLKLTQKSIPSWVNRLARLGFLCNCVLPACLNEAKVKRVGKDGKLLEGESKKKRKKKKARSRSGPLSSSSSNSRLDNNPTHNRSKSTGNPPLSSSPSCPMRPRVPCVASGAQDQKPPSRYLNASFCSEVQCRTCFALHERMNQNEGDALVDSIKAKLVFLSSLSTKCCIYKVPNKLRRLNPDAYTPRLVSFGPLHRGKEELQAMEDHKYRYLQSFIPRTNSSLEDLVRVARTWEQNARSCYAEDVKLNSDEFVEMLVVDGSFLVELLLRSHYPRLRGDKDRVFGNSMMITDVCRDMILIENQLPFFVVKEIFLLLFIYYQQGTPSIIQLAQRHFSYFLSRIDDEKFISEPEHFVDLLRSCYLPQLPIRLEYTTLKVDNAPEATELHTAGVRFKPAETSSCLLDISFADGVLKIPTIVVDDLTESLYRNIIVYEQCHCSNKNFLHYTTLLGCFIKSPTDADLLIRSGIIVNHLGNSVDVSKLFNSISKEVIYDRRFYFSTLSENLQAYCNTPWNRWKANLRRDYFHNPWSVASVFAALFLLLLTFIQAVCSILAL
ncbi:PPPDE putative peptidase domain [Arabidopsis suecica]|uniref:PPPDE putative peptidase domain n=1 Tax=Arabidopsis suecica TaxID=45249 RepID=A0A8T1YHA8_ARASU|nr:PPPDE putative peptidase domain [Arabidopsis suecica]